MAEIVEIGKVSSRGQIAIPSDIREEMGMKEGQKVVFFLNGDTLMIKKVMDMSWEEITAPLKKAAKNSKFREEDIPDLIAKVRAEKRRK